MIIRFLIASISLALTGWLLRSKANDFLQSPEWVKNHPPDRCEEDLALQLTIGNTLLFLAVACALITLILVGARFI